MIKREKNELQDPHFTTHNFKENQFRNQSHEKNLDGGEEYLFPYWDEYWDESDKS